MRTVALLLVLALPQPARSETPNLALAPEGAPGAVARLILAQRTYQAAMDAGDTVMLLAAIRLAREITLRPPTGWTRTTTGEATADQPIGATAPPDPAGPKLLAVAQALAGEDPDLQDQVYALDAQLPHAPRVTATEATGELGGGQTDHWQLVLFGAVPAEVGLIGDADSPLALTVTDAEGATVCARPAGTDPVLCGFTPARNGFFTVEIRNTGSEQNSYRLLAN